MVKSFEQLIAGIEKTTEKGQPEDRRAAIYDVEVVFHNPNIKRVRFPELKHNYHVSGNDYFGFGRNHHFNCPARRCVYFDGEDVDVSFHKKDFRAYTVADKELQIQLKDRKLAVTLNEHSLCDNFDESLKR